jgi:enoyl-CoA hydratase/carnithine racemase
MTWVVTVLAGLSGLFYGLWMRSKYNAEKAYSKGLASKLAEQMLLTADAIARREAVIDELKGRLYALQKKFVDTADANAVNDILNSLYPPKSDT